MKPLLKPIFVIIFTLMSQACSTMTSEQRRINEELTERENVEKVDNWIKANCNKDAAYSIGVDHAYKGKNHDTTEFDNCDPKISGSIKRSYSEGYSSIKSNPKVMIRENIENSKKESLYICKLSIFGKTYEEKSWHKGIAKFTVIENCRKDNHSMHCNYKVKCMEYK